MCVHILTESKQANVVKCKLIPLLRGREHHNGKEKEEKTESNRLMSSLPRNSGSAHGEQMSYGFVFALWHTVRNKLQQHAVMINASVCVVCHLEVDALETDGG